MKNNFYNCEVIEGNEDNDYHGVTIVKDSDMIRGVKELMGNDILDIYESRTHFTHSYYLIIKLKHSMIWGDDLYRLMFLYNLHISSITTDKDGIKLSFEIFDYKETFNRYFKMVKRGISMDIAREKIKKIQKKG